MGCQTAPSVHLCSCHGLGLSAMSKQLGCLSVLVADPTHLPTGPPVIHNTCDITESFQKSAVSTSCRLCSYNNAPIRLVYFCANLAWLQSSIRELQCLELVFLKIQNVTIWSACGQIVCYTMKRIFTFLH